LSTKRTELSVALCLDYIIIDTRSFKAAFRPGFNVNGCHLLFRSLPYISLIKENYKLRGTSFDAPRQEKIILYGKHSRMLASGGAMAANFDLVRFGERLREVRVKRELTLKDVSQEIDISIPTLSRVERGDAKEIESKTLFALCDWAKLPLELFQEQVVPVKRVGTVRKDIATPDAVELHLRADKNLNPRTAELLVKMFRAAYQQAASESDE
jgi:transcriptional regulator with XRE-family HTH domain